MKTERRSAATFMPSTENPTSSLAKVKKVAISLKSGSRKTRKRRTCHT
jgi:hypothetical protein